MRIFDADLHGVRRDIGGAVMIEGMRQWLLSITGVALVIAAVDSLCPEGTVKRVMRLMGGLVFLSVILQPVAGLTVGDSLDVQGDHRRQVEETADRAAEEEKNLMETIIAGQTAAYIVDKAGELGADCQASVRCERGSDGLIVPVGVRVTGALTARQREELARIIEKELAIPRENQIFEGGEEL